MRVLVTRPQPEADALCARLAALGHAPLVDPLLFIEPLDPPLGDLDAYWAVLATSRNGLLGLARQTGSVAQLAGRPLFVVGGATARLARDLGFRRVIEGPGTAAGLVATVRAHLAPAGGPLLYLTGEVVAFDLAAALTAHGYAVVPAVVYRAQTANCFAPATLAALEAQQLDAVVLLSARTAATYASLARVHNQLENIQNICHLCLSDTIAGELRALRPRIIRVAAHPTIEELLALAGHAAKPLP